MPYKLTKNVDKLIPWEEIKKEHFSPEEIAQMESEVKEKLIRRELRDTRRKQKISQIQLAKRTKLPRSTIARFEDLSSTASLRTDTLRRYAAGLGLTIEMRAVPIEQILEDKK